MLPLSTTTLTVQRRTQTGDPYEAPGAVQSLYSVRGVISSPSGRERAVGGAQELTEAEALLPPGTALTHLDWLLDTGTGVTWSVVWVQARQGLGLDHVVAGVNRVQGAAA